MHLVDSTLFYSAESGGVLTYLHAKAAWLASQKRLRHTLVGPAGNQLLDQHHVLVPSMPVPFLPPYRMPLSIACAAAALRKLQPDLIEVGDPYQFAWAALRIKHETGVPLIGFYHTDLPAVVAQRFGLRSKALAQRYIQRLYRDFDLVFAPSRVMVQQLTQLGIERVVHQPLGVDTSVFTPKRKVGDFRARLGLPANTRLMLYVGRLTQQKKLPLLIEATHRLGAPYHLIVIGNGEQPHRHPHITTLCHRTDPVVLARLIASCDLLVHPSDQETFGLVVLEAMACGLPVLGTNAGGVAELVDTDTGLLVAPGKVDTLITGIRTLYQRDLTQLGAAARRKACALYDWTRIFPAWYAHSTGLLTLPQRIAPEPGVPYAAE